MTGMVEVPAPAALLPRPVLERSVAADAAAADADAAATRAKVTVREPTGPEELDATCDLFARIWREPPGDRSMTPRALRALSHAGNYVSLALCEDKIIGACTGFFGLADEWKLHSHIAGVDASAQGRNVGFALKTHQRAWVLLRGLDRVSWTYDPLVRRNAYFNLCKLAVSAQSYIVDFYGPMADGINAGDESDRVVVEWHLDDANASLACAGHPREVEVESLRRAGASVALSADATGRPAVGPRHTSTVLVGVPEDIERLRLENPAAARDWRFALRDVLGGLVEDGAQVTGFNREGWYVVQRGQA